jgi:PAS domain S-box-containing protein
VKSATLTAKPGMRRRVVVVALILAAGAALTHRQVRRADEQMRDDLLRQTMHIARALNPEHVTALSGTEADLSSHRYARLKTQLLQARLLYSKCRFLYLTGRKPDGTIFFFVDSEPADSEDGSPPGETYEEATEVFQQVFTSREPATEGPVADRWGAWVSAFAPIPDHRTGGTLAVLGMDIDADRWKSQLVRHAVPPVLFTVILFVVTVAGSVLVEFRARHSFAFRVPLLRNADALLAAVVGLTLTLEGAYLAHDGETLSRREAFCRLAMSQADLVEQAISRIRNYYLEALGRLFESSNFVDRRDFHSYAGYLVKHPVVRAWEWIPSVAAADKDRFEADVRIGGAPDFAIWEQGPSGERIPAAGRETYYPVCYVEPLSGNETALGYDLGSEPTRRAALETARQTGLMTATDPLALVQRPGLTNAILAVRPVFNRVLPDQLSGFALAVVPMDTLLPKTLRREFGGDRPAVIVDLYQLKAGAAPLFLSSTGSDAPGAGVEDSTPFHAVSGPLFLTAPVFAFGRVYAVAVRPGPAFPSLYPVKAGWGAAWTGLALTALLTALVFILTSRRAVLEQQVQERTAELRASEASYRGLFNSIRQAIYIQDGEGRFLDVNDGAVAMYGYAREEFLGRTPDFLSAPGRNDLAAVQEHIRRAFAGEPQYLEFWGRRKNGEIFPKDVWLCSGTYLGQPVMIAVASDISARRRAEQEARDLHERLATFIEAIPDAVFIKDGDGRWLVINRAAAKLFKLETFAWRGKSDAELAAARPDFRAIHEHCIRSDEIAWLTPGVSIGIEEVAGPDGRPLTYEVRKLALFDRNGGRKTLIAIGRDITERRLAEEALRASEARLNEAQRIAHVGSWELNLQTNELSWSDEIYRMFGIEPQTFGATYEAFLDAVHPDDREFVNQAYAGSVRNRTPYDIVHRLRMKDGTIRFVQERCETLYDAEGKPIRSVGTVQDITERRRAEDERERLQTQLVQAQKMESVGRLAGGVAHDFNNMLQAILGNASLALDEAPKEGVLRESIGEIQKSAERAAGLTRQLLAFASKQTIRPRILDLNDTVSGMLRMLQRLIGEDIQLLWAPGADLWPVKMDPTQIDQILANLVINARDAISGGGRIIIRSSNTVCDEDAAREFPGCRAGDYVVLSVADNGKGIDAETRAHLFEPFYTTKSPGRGVGLGLATVFGIVKQNHGFVSVQSEPGKGATFRVLLPRIELPAPGGRVEPAKPAARGGTECLLVVEDEKAILQFGHKALERLGYSVLTAGSPKEAIRLAREFSGRIDLLITDVVMPEMNGQELAHVLAALRPGLKFLFMSGHTPDVIARRGVLDETVHFIQKPFTLEALTAKVREVLEEPADR